MKKSEFICENCLCRIDANPGDLMTDLCALGPVRVPVHPKHFCASGKWPERYATLPRAWGQWEAE